MLSETSFLDVEMISVFYERPVAIRGILRALSTDPLMVWFGVFLVGELGELSEGTGAEVYGVHNCKNEYESNATLQFSTEHKTNKEKSCLPFVFGLFLLLP